MELLNPVAFVGIWAWSYMRGGRACRDSVEGNPGKKRRNCEILGNILYMTVSAAV